MLTNREMENFKKLDIFRFFFILFTINGVNTGARKRSIEYIICFIYSQPCITITRRSKCVALLDLYSRKVLIITLPLHFFDRIRTSHGIASTITKLIDFYSLGVFTFLIATVFN